jgi:hypothetical protein
MCALLLIAAGCGSPSVPEATEAFCQSLVAYGESLTALKNLSPTTTVGEAKDAQKVEQDARKAVEKAARNLREAKLDSIDQAWTALDKTVRQISNQDTLGEVAGQIESVLVALRAAYEQLGLNNCPDLFPAAAEGLPEPAAGEPSQPITGTQPSEAVSQPVTATQASVTATVPSTLTTAAPEEPASTSPVSPVGVLWQLQEIELTSGSSTMPSDPALYTLMLEPDGTANVTADCIAGAGTYTIAGTTISFVLRYDGTMCPSPSIASQYTRYLGYANSFALENDTLVIGYSNDAGKMTFTQAAQ